MSKQRLGKVLMGIGLSRLTIRAMRVSHEILRGTLACSVVLGFGCSAWGTQIARWDFSSLPGGSGNFGASPLAATSNDVNVTIGGLTRGSGIGTAGTGASKAWGGNSLQETSQANAVAGNDFATFTLAVKGGYTVSLSEIPVYNIRRSGTGPTTGIWQYQVDGGSFVDIGSAITWGSVTTGTGNDQSAISLSGIAALQNLSAGSVVTFRVVTWGGTSSSGTWYLNDPTSGSRDLIVNGSVTAVVVAGDSDSCAAAPDTQVAAGDLSSLATTSESAADVLSFKVQDSGTGDGLDTKVTRVTVKPASGNTADWSSTIQGVALYDVSDGAAVTIGAPVIANTSIVIPIPSDSLTVSNGVSKDLRLSVWLKSGGLVDNAALHFKIDASAPGFMAETNASSSFASVFAADVVGNPQTLRVAATRLGYASVPKNVVVSQDFSVAVQAQDANGNVDADGAASVSLTLASGNGAISGNGAQTLTAGVATFAGLSLDTLGTVTLRASGGEFADVVSDAVSVVRPLSIFHVNDTHARLTPHWFVVPGHDKTNEAFELVGGAACLATAVLQARTDNPASLFLDAGDISEGNPVGDMNGNGAMVQFYNLLDAKLKAAGDRGIDASVVGNHDVRDYSYITNLLNASYPVISMNICSNGTHAPFFRPYVTVTVDGTKVGILGYTTSASEVGASVDPMIDVVACDWAGTGTNAIHVADYVKKLRTDEGCDLVVLLAHVGQTALCVSNSTSAAVLVDDGIVRVPEIAVTGHWHTWAETAWQPELLNYKTIFTEAASYMKYLGELNVDRSGRYLGASQHILRNADYPADEDVAAFVQSLKETYDTAAVAEGRPQLDDVIGYTAEPLYLDNIMKWWSVNEYPWNGDNTAGEWICDAMRWKAEQVFGTPCQLALEAGGGVRADVPAGPVTYTQIYETFPWNDDLLTLVKMTGQEIWNFVKANDCNAALSQGWLVTAHDGVPVSITYNGQSVGLTNVYNVAINNYMYVHPTSDFSYSDTNAQVSAYLCRQGIVDYTAQFTKDNPMTVPGPRYSLDTEFSGGYRAVVTLMNDADSSTSYEDAFIRLLAATPETLARRGGKQVPTDLVNADGTINPTNRLAETELYRSFLGFKAGVLKRGTIIEVWGKNTAYQGNPEFVDQEGIYGDGVEFKILGYDESLAQPEYASSIHAFWNDSHKNHYVKFYAKKTGANTVADQYNTALTVMDATAYSKLTLPGTTGDLLQLTGVPTSESYGLRFRCDSAVLASSVGVSNYPPVSSVRSLAPESGTEETVTLTASVNADVAPMTLLPVADAQVVSGYPASNYGTSKTYLYAQSSSVSSYGNERSWLKFDLSSLSGTITGARLNLYCWKTAGTSLPVVALGSDDDSWTESGITWSNQPNASVAQALATNTLASGITDVWYTWDATSFVSNQFVGDQAASIALKALVEDSADAIAPSYAFEAREYGSNQPFLEVDTEGGTNGVQKAAEVRFLYRYSPDGATWGAWTLCRTVSAEPWTTSFACTNGIGHYEFHSVAVGVSGDAEPAPSRADAAYERISPPLAVNEPDAVVPNGTASCTLHGTTADAAGVIALTNSLGGAALEVAAGAAWTFADVPLAVGVNSFTIIAGDAAGAVYTQKVTVIRQAAPAADGALRIASFSDPHYFATNLLVRDGAAFQTYIAQDRKLIAESAAIAHAVIDQLIAQNPNVVLVAGDLTKDGELASHLAFSNELARIEAAGAQVLVIPGNHDINNSGAVSYDGASTAPVPNVSPEQFKAIYAPFGYDLAVATDTVSVGYAVELTPEVTLLCMDACEYGATAGAFDAGRLAWITNQLAVAHAQGRRVIGMMHHGLMEHFQGQKTLFPEYVIDDYSTLAPLFASLGMKAVFTGHFHANDVVGNTYNGKTIYDIETGSTVTWPCPYRVMELGTNGALNIVTRRVEAIDYNLNGAADFQTYAHTFLTNGMATLTSYMLQASPFYLDAATAAYLAPSVTEAMVDHYAGDEPGLSGASVATRTIVGNLLAGDAQSRQLGGAIHAILTDPSPADNNVTLDLSTPPVAITEPVSGAVLDASEASVTLVVDTFGLVGDLLFGNETLGTSLTGAVGGTSPALMLAYGANVLTVTGTNALGQAYTATVTVTREAPTPANGTDVSPAWNYAVATGAVHVAWTTNDWYQLQSFTNCLPGEFVYRDPFGGDLEPGDGAPVARGSAVYRYDAADAARYAVVNADSVLSVRVPCYGGDAVGAPVNQDVVVRVTYWDAPGNAGWVQGWELAVTPEGGTATEPVLVGREHGTNGLITEAYSFAVTNATDGIKVTFSADPALSGANPAYVSEIAVDTLAHAPLLVAGSLDGTSVDASVSELALALLTDGLIGELTFRNETTGITRTGAVGGASPALALAYGLNVLTVSGTNAAGQAYTATVTVTREAPTPTNGTNIQIAWDYTVATGAVHVAWTTNDWYQLQSFTNCLPGEFAYRDPFGVETEPGDGAPFAQTRGSASYRYDAADAARYAVVGANADFSVRVPCYDAAAVGVPMNEAVVVRVSYWDAPGNTGWVQGWTLAVTTEGGTATEPVLMGRTHGADGLITEAYSFAVTNAAGGIQVAFSADPALSGANPAYVSGVTVDTLAAPNGAVHVIRTTVEGEGTATPARVMVGDGASTNIEVNVSGEWRRIQSLTTNGAAVAEAANTRSYTLRLADVTGDYNNRVVVGYRPDSENPDGVPTDWLASFGRGESEPAATGDRPMADKYRLDIDPYTAADVTFDIDGFSAEDGTLRVIVRLLVDGEEHDHINGTLRVEGRPSLSGDWSVIGNTPVSGAVFENGHHTYEIPAGTNRFFRAVIH